MLGLTKIETNFVMCLPSEFWWRICHHVSWNWSRDMGKVIRRISKFQVISNADEILHVSEMKAEWVRLKLDLVDVRLNYSDCLIRMHVSANEFKSAEMIDVLEDSSYCPAEKCMAGRQIFKCMHLTVNCRQCVGWMNLWEVWDWR